MSDTLSAIRTRMGRAEVAILLVLGLLWGGSYFFVEILLQSLPPFSIIAVRLTLASAVLWGLVAVTRTPVPRHAGGWATLATVGLIGVAVPFMLIVWGQTRITGGLAAILNATAPLFTVVIAGLFLTDERITLAKFGGVAIGLLGVGVLVGPSAILNANGSALGQAAVILAALCYSVAGIVSRRFSRIGISPLMVATGQCSLAAILMVPLAIATDGLAPLAAAPCDAWLALLALALLSTVLAYILYFRLIDRAGATNAVLVAYLIPVSAIALGAMFLGERLTPMQLAGGALIGVGLLVTDGRIFSRA
ncbi:DMT family transporter [Algimonas porphyrae]|nr:DMT family transporter [Algimonas porphyrae]